MGYIDQTFRVIVFDKDDFRPKDKRCTTSQTIKFNSHPSSGNQNVYLLLIFQNCSYIRGKKKRKFVETFSSTFYVFLKPKRHELLINLYPLFARIVAVRTYKPPPVSSYVFTLYEQSSFRSLNRLTRTLRSCLHARQTFLTFPAQQISLKKKKKK